MGGLTQVFLTGVTPFSSVFVIMQGSQAHCKKWSMGCMTGAKTYLILLLTLDSRLLDSALVERSSPSVSFFHAPQDFKTRRC